MCQEKNYDSLVQNPINIIFCHQLILYTFGVGPRFAQKKLYFESLYLTFDLV